MWKHLMLFNILGCGFVYGFYNKFITKGRWIVDRMERCPDHESYPYRFEIHKRKVNRTHDGFYGELEFLEDITEDEFSITIEACKQVIGGCRHVATLNDESFCRFFVEYAEENFKRLLRNIGVKDQCPVPKGQYKVDDFLFDNTEIAEEGMVGHFLAIAILMKHEARLACLAIHVHFAERDEDDDD